MMTKCLLTKIRLPARFRRMGKIQRSMLAVIITLTALLWFKHYSGFYYLNKKEKQMINTLITNPSSRYFGFYSMALPDDFSTGGMLLYANGSNGTVISSKMQYYPPFRQFLIRHEEELKNIRPLHSENEPYLKRTYPLYCETPGVIFERMKNWLHSDNVRILEGWKWHDMVTFSVNIEALDERANRYIERNKKYNLKNKYNVPEKLRQMQTLLQALLPRKDNEPPANGRFATAFSQVDVSLLWQLPYRTSGDYELRMGYGNEKGIWFSIETHNWSTRENILNEYSVIGQNSWGNTLYRGKRTINGVKVSEWLFKRLETNEYWQRYYSYHFFLTVLQDTPNFTDRLRITMDYSTEDVKPEDILPEAVLRELWDQITATLKYYPPKT